MYVRHARSAHKSQKVLHPLELLGTSGKEKWTKEEKDDGWRDRKEKERK